MITIIAFVGQSQLRQLRCLCITSIYDRLCISQKCCYKPLHGEWTADTPFTDLVLDYENSTVSIVYHNSDGIWNIIPSFIALMITTTTDSFPRSLVPISIWAQRITTGRISSLVSGAAMRVRGHVTCTISPGHLEHAWNTLHLHGVRQQSGVSVITFYIFPQVWSCLTPLVSQYLILMLHKSTL